MTPAQKLSSTFKDKSQFENEIALCGFRLNDGIKEHLKELQESGEIDESLLRKYKLISSTEHFSKHVELLLDEVGKEINDKVNIVAEVNLKSDFLYSSIQKLSELIKKIEQISQQYPKINLDKLQKKIKLLLTTLNIQDDKPSNIRISDDIIEEMVGMGKKMRDVQVTKSILSEFLNGDISDIYMNCLYHASITVTSTIHRIISENECILSADFNFSKTSPFLKLKEQTEQRFIKKDISFSANEYALAYIFDLYSMEQQVPTNRIEGGYAAKKIKEDSSLFTSYNKTPDGFYRAVIKVLTYDLNNPSHLQNISKDWQNAVQELSNNWKITKQYLTNKKLIKE